MPYPAENPQAPAAVEPTPPEAAPLAPPSSAEPTAITAESVRALTPEQRKAVLFGAAEPETAPAAAEVTDPPSVVEPPAPPVIPPPENEPESDRLPKNFRMHTEDPKLSGYLKALKLAMVANPGVNPADVARLHGYTLPTTQAPAASDPPTEPTVVAPTIAGLQAEMAEMATKIKEATNEELGSNEIEDLRLAREAKLAELVTLQTTERIRAELAEERKAERAKSERVSAREAVKLDVLKDYPMASDDESLHGAEIARLYAEIQANPQHADRARLNEDDGPRWLSDEARDRVSARLVRTLGYTEAQALDAIKGKPVAVAKGPAAATPPVPAQRPVPRTAIVAATTGRPAPDVDVQSTIERAKSDPKLRRELLFGAPV